MKDIVSNLGEDRIKGVSNKKHKEIILKNVKKLKNLDQLGKSNDLKKIPNTQEPLSSNPDKSPQIIQRITKKRRITRSSKKDKQSGLHQEEDRLVLQYQLPVTKRRRKSKKAPEDIQVHRIQRPIANNELSKSVTELIQKGSDLNGILNFSSSQNQEQNANYSSERIIKKLSENQLLEIVNEKKSADQMLYLVRWKSVKGKIPPDCYISSTQLKKYELKKIIEYYENKA